MTDILDTWTKWKQARADKASHIQLKWRPCTLYAPWHAHTPYIDIDICHIDHPLLVGCINCSFSMMLIMTRAKLKTQSALSLLIVQRWFCSLSQTWSWVPVKTKMKITGVLFKFCFSDILFKFVCLKSNISYLNTKNNINKNIIWHSVEIRFCVYCFKYGNFFSPSTFSFLKITTNLTL